MAIFIEGMPCRLCNKPMVKGQKVVAFSPFVTNEADPLSFFSDCVFHAECFQNHPQAADAEARHHEALEKNKPASRRCLVCSQPITTPDDYFPLGYLTDDAAHPLHRFNFAHFHRACVNRWPELQHVTDFATKQLESGAWKGKGMQRLVNALKAGKT